MRRRQLEERRRNEEERRRGDEIFTGFRAQEAGPERPGRMRELRIRQVEERRRKEQERRLLEESYSGIQEAGPARRIEISVSSLKGREEEGIVTQQKPMSKREMFRKIIHSQKATGQFVDVESFVDELKSFNYGNLDKVVLQTFFIIHLLEVQFKELKIEWLLIATKALQWLKQQNVKIPDDIKSELSSIIQKMTF